MAILHYIDNNEQKTLDVKIIFISHSMAKKWDKILTKIREIKKLGDFLHQDLIIQGSIYIDKKLSKEEQLVAIEEHNKKIEEARDKLESLMSRDIIEERLDLILDILAKNSVEDKFLLRDFWTEQVDTGEMMSFINRCVYKHEA